MKIILFAGAPAVGKTSVLLKTLTHIQALTSYRLGVAKIDCLQSHDHLAYQALNIPIITGLSQNLCPDHYLAINLVPLHQHFKRQGTDIMIVETAGLCNRCAPFISNALNVCVVDSTSGTKSPEKLGPMVTTATIIVLTKSDMISQAEREILIDHLQQLNPMAELLVINGVSGAGSRKLSQRLLAQPDIASLDQERLIHDMPAAICSYCVGEHRLGCDYHQGILNYIDLGGSEIENTNHCRL